MWALTVEELEGAKERVTAKEARFERPWGYIALAVLAWAAFWEFAERNQRNPYSQLLAWMAVAMAVIVAWYL